MSKLQFESADELVEFLTDLRDAVAELADRVQALENALGKKKKKSSLLDELFKGGEDE